MKKLLALGFILVGFSAQAAVLVSEKTAILPVDLTTTGIRLSKSGYSMPTVKVLIPELAAETVMDHRNPGETAPCVATFETWNVEDVVQGQPEVLQVPFTIRLEKELRVVGDICKVQLTETVEGDVRGFKFTHVRSSPLPDRVVEDCK